MTQYDLGQVVGATGATGPSGADGASVWNTSTAPTYANSKYTFTISNLSGRSGVTIAVNDIIFYDTYYYIVSTKNSTTVDCTTRVSIKGADGSSASVTIVDNLNSDSSTSVLSAKQGKVLNTNKIETSAIATSFASTTSDSKVPSEKLTKTELDKKITKASTATGLLKDNGDVMTGGTGSSNWAIGNHNHSGTYAPSSHNHSTDDVSDPDSDDYTNIGELQSNASQSRINSEIDTALGTKITKSSSATGLLKDDGTVMTSGTGSTNWAVGNHTHSAYVNPTIVDNLTSDSSTSVLSAKQGKVLNTNKIETSAIADNLTTNDATKVLSAKQGKVLNDLIGSAITYITGSGS